jgi:heme exporter protein B
MLAGFVALLKKDLRSELRGKEVLILHLTISLLLAAVVGLGIQNAFLTRDQIQALSPLFIWLIFIFAGTVSVARSFEYESNFRAIDGVILTGFPAGLVFLSKCLANVLVILLGHLVSISALAVLLNLSILSVLAQLLLLSLLVCFGYSALATLLSAITASSRLKGMLLPLILMPLLFPLFFGAIELTAQLFSYGSVDFSSGWLSLILVFDLLYLVVAMNLFEYSLGE